MSRQVAAMPPEVVSEAHAGAEYVHAIQQHASDRQARETFQSLALTHARPGCAIFDFGAGAGIDARFFAERGLRVRVYDNDPRMRRYLAETCRDLIDAGRIVPEAGEYEDFLIRTPDPALPPVHLVIANVAPLDLIDDLSVLFAKLHALTAPGGALLASVLSPYFLGDLKYGWRWRGMIEEWHSGRLITRGARGNIIRRRLPVFSAECAPWFRLERVFRGLPPRDAAEAAGMDFTLQARTTWLRLTRCRFMFLLFRREARSTASQSRPPCNRHPRAAP